MAFETDLRTLLLAESTITDLVPAQTVGGTSYPRIFNEHPKRGITPPYILIHQIDFDPYVCIDGTTGLESYEIDIDCYSVTADAALAISDAVSAYIKDFAGTAGSSSIKAVVWLSKRMDVIQEAQGRDVQYHVSSVSYLFQVT